MMNVIKICPMCGVENNIKCSASKYADWKYGGVLIQHAFPDMPLDDREVLMTGICPPCYSSLGGEEDE
mgnify:CR=1 FL=1